MAETAIIPSSPAALVTVEADARCTDPARWAFVVAEWIKTRKTERTRKIYADIRRAFSEYVGVELWEVTALHVTQWRDSMAGLSDATIAQRLTAIASLYTYAMKKSDPPLTTYNPVASVPRPQVEAYGKSRHLDRAQVDAVLKQPNRATVEGKRDYAMLVLEMTTAIRRAELVSIRRSDLVDLPTGEIRLVYRPKGGDEKTRILPKSAVSALREYLVERGPLEASDPVFVAHDRGAHKRAARPLTAEAWRNIVTKYTRKALGYRVHPHALRHSAGWELWQQTKDVQKVKKLLGHKNIETTMIYLDHQDDDRAAWGDDLAAAFGVR